MLDISENVIIYNKIYLYSIQNIYIQLKIFLFYTFYIVFNKKRVCVPTWFT